MKLTNEQIQQLINSIKTIETIMKDCGDDTAYHYELDDIIVSIADDRFGLLNLNTDERLLFVQQKEELI